MRQVSGVSMMDDPATNKRTAFKGTAFSFEERKRHRLEGLLPLAVETIERQLEPVLGHLDQKPSDLERYIYLGLKRSPTNRNTSEA